ncbi:hypothetical protein PAXINDRAFT_64679, partial [Paxillus involutus ATCC 200175]
MKQQIAVTVPNSLFIRFRGLKTAKEIYDFLVNEFENCSHVVTIELRRKLLELKCPDKADVHAHFDKMWAIQEELASIGSPLVDNDFIATILGSLSNSYEPNIQATTALAKVLGKSLTPDLLMGTITDEYN